MNTALSKHFYLFKGDWYGKFIEILELIKNSHQQFIIWEPLDKTKDHNLIITYGEILPKSFCVSKKIWKTDETVFNSFYKHKIDRFNLHGNFNATTNEDHDMELTGECFSEN